MLKIGVTGGIGSGKTTVCNIFKLLGIPVYNADIRAKYLMNTDGNLKSKIESIFGKNSYLKNGELNRKHIAEIAFNDKSKLLKLNSAVHPEVKKDFENWVNSQSSAYIIKETALLFETGSYKDLDYTILVSAPIDIRIARVMARDNTDKESVLARINNQMAEKEKSQMSDFIIKNDGDHSLIHQILLLDKKFKEIDAEVQ